MKTGNKTKQGAASDARTQIESALELVARALFPVGCPGALVFFASGNPDAPEGLMAGQIPVEVAERSELALRMVQDALKATTSKVGVVICDAAQETASARDRMRARADLRVWFETQGFSPELIAEAFGSVLHVDDAPSKQDGLAR
jgi:hypothetical protein